MNKEKGYVSAELLETITNIVQISKQNSYSQMKIKEGHHVLDVGCGPGSDTIALSKLVGAKGRVVGIDKDEEMIKKANSSFEQLNIEANVNHILGDALNLPFNCNEFDSCRCERLFQHLQNPKLALSEMVRVTKKGGQIVVIDTDWGSTSIDTNLVDIERRLVRVLSEKCFFNGYSGRQLHRFFKQQNLTDIFIEIIPHYITDYSLWKYVKLLDRAQDEALSLGVISEAELTIWVEELERADREGLFFGMGNMILASGKKQ